MHPNEKLARRELELLNAGDMAALQGLYADDFVLHYPGHSPLAGDHTGSDFLEKVGRLLGDDGKVTRKLHDAFGNDDHAVQLLTVTGEARGRSHSWTSVVVMHVRDGKIAEAWIHFADQYGIDNFLTSLAG